MGELLEQTKAELEVMPRIVEALEGLDEEGRKNMLIYLRENCGRDWGQVTDVASHYRGWLEGRVSQWKR